MSFYVKGLQNCGPPNLTVKKNCKNDAGAFPCLSLSSNENVVFGRSGFDSPSLLTLRASNFEAPWPAGSKTSFFERSDLYLLGNGKKIGFAAL